MDSAFACFVVAFLPLLLLLGQPLLPLGGLFRPVGFFVKLHQSLKRFLEAGLPDGGGDGQFARFHALVAGTQRRLGVFDHFQICFH